MIGLIEVGVSYVTRNGSTVTIEHDKGDNFYPLFGTVIGNDGQEGRIAYFTKAGQYSIGRETGFDIVGRTNVHP